MYIFIRNCTSVHTYVFISYVLCLPKTVVTFQQLLRATFQARSVFVFVQNAYSSALVTARNSLLSTMTLAYYNH